MTGFECDFNRWPDERGAMMSDWNSGYVTDLDYTYGYYSELNPLRVRLPFLCAGLQPPAVATACELGYGQGMSVNIHAAASDTQWFGTDFNPAHAGFAQSLAAASGADAKLYEQAFLEFCARDDLPDFDFVGLHGIFSWISDENRHVIVDFLARKLRPGGVLYVSYNTQPGWAAMTPMRELMFEHNATMGAPGVGVVARFEAALGFVDKLMATNPAFARANPSVQERLTKIRTQDRNYLVHEYFDRDWLPISFAQMKSWLAPAKLSYACSANYLDNLDAVCLTPEQQALAREIPDAGLRELVRDFCKNQTFRRDYWVKGPRRLTGLAQAELLRTERVLLARARPDVEFKINGPLGEATLQESVHVPIMDALAGHRAVTFGQLEQAVKGKGITLPQIAQAVMVNASNGTIVPVHDDATIGRARKLSAKLNLAISDLARGAGDVQHVASPVLGGGFQLGRFGILFMLAGARGRKAASERARFAWDVMSAQGHWIVKDGVRLETAEANVEDLTRRAQTFVERQVPILEALGIV